MLLKSAHLMLHSVSGWHKRDGLLRNDNLFPEMMAVFDQHGLPLPLPPLKIPNTGELPHAHEVNPISRAGQSHCLCMYGHVKSLEMDLAVVTIAGIPRANSQQPMPESPVTAVNCRFFGVFPVYGGCLWPDPVHPTIPSRQGAMSATRDYLFGTVAFFTQATRTRKRI